MTCLQLEKSELNISSHSFLVCVMSRWILKSLAGRMLSCRISLSVRKFSLLLSVSLALLLRLTQTIVSHHRLDGGQVHKHQNCLCSYSISYFAKQLRPPPPSILMSLVYSKSSARSSFPWIDETPSSNTSLCTGRAEFERPCWLNRVPAGGAAA